MDWVQDQFFIYLDSDRFVKVEYSTIEESDLLLATENMRSNVINRKKDADEAILGFLEIC